LYGFPYCNYDAGKLKNETRCSAKYQNFNDRMKYIYDNSQALYPSIYLNNKADPERNFRYVQAIIAETKRVAEVQRKTNNRKLPIFVYTKFEYDPFKDFKSYYTMEDLCSTILLPYLMGVDGFIFWSTSNDMPKRCTPIPKYVEDTLGPFVQDVVKGRHGQMAKVYEPNRVWQFEKVCPSHVLNTYKTNSNF
ncbi:Hyaluronidase, partial [Trichostrongylus colubriformis]